MTELKALQDGVPTTIGAAEARKDRQFVTALARGLSILRAFRCEDRVLGNQELAIRTRLPKPTVTRLTYTLTELGYLNYNTEFGKYELGTSVLALGYAALANFDIRQMARPHMRALSEANNVGVGLATPDGQSMVYIEYCSPPTLVTLRIDVGLRLPMIETATGLAYLSGVDDLERQRLMKKIRERGGSSDWPKLEERINTAREDTGHAGLLHKNRCVGSRRQRRGDAVYGTRRRWSLCFVMCRARLPCRSRSIGEGHRATTPPRGQTVKRRPF